MLERMIYYFDKNSEERKLFKMYILLSSPVPLTLLILIFIIKIYSLNLYLYFSLFIFMICFDIIFIYLYMCIVMNIKIFSRELFKIRLNIYKYSDYSKNKNVELVVNYLKENNLFSKEKIYFLIKLIISKKEPKFKRDWISLIINVLLTILVASIEEVNINLHITAILLQYGIIIILYISSMYIIYKCLIKFIYDNLSIKYSLERVEMILTEVYLNFDNVSIQNMRIYNNMS